MHSIIQDLEVKIYVVQKFKNTKLKITPTCFGSYVIHHQEVQSFAWLKLHVVFHRYFVVCLVGVWQRNFEPVVCVYGTAGSQPVVPYRCGSITTLTFYILNIFLNSVTLTRNI